MKLFWFTLLLCFEVGGSTWYVATNGTAGGSGAVADPLTLVKALSSTSPVIAGDTVYLRSGSYNGSFSSYLNGTISSPIIVRSHPGESAVITATTSGGVGITVNGSNSWFMDLRINNSTTNRFLDRGAGFYILGPNTKVIHCVIHDTGTGIGAWTEAPDTELVGNIIYFNGYQDVDPDRGHGHGIYMQNLTGTKLVRNNIIFNQFSKGIQAYGNEGFLRHMIVSNNIVFNNGGANRAKDAEDNYLFGGNQSAIDITCVSNVSYCWSTGGTINRFGYANGGPGCLNDGLLVANNYFAGGGANWIGWWTNAIVTNNIFKNNQSTFHYRTDGIDVGTIDWNRNTYYSGGSWTVNETNIYNFTQWKVATGFDANSTQVSESTRPTPVIHIFHDPYTANLGQISIINWASNDVAAVDFSSVLLTGQAYTLRNAQDYYGVTVLSGTYAGGTVNVPMTNLSYTLPLGVTNIPPISSPVFNAFVLQGYQTATIGTLNVRGN